MIKKGDRIRECKYGVCIESIVITDVEINDRGQSVFTSVTDSGVEIEYMKSHESLEVINGE